MTCIKPIGYETIWKDRKGRIRTKVKVEHGKRFVDKRIVVWGEHNPGDDLKGYCIIHLDGNTQNFDIDNLFKIKKEIFLLMLNNHLYYQNKELNLTGILIATNLYKAKRCKNGNTNWNKERINRSTT